MFRRLASSVTNDTLRSVDSHLLRYGMLLARYPVLKIVDGIIIDGKVKVDICPLLGHGPMSVIHALIMHQTDSSSASGTLSKYKNTKSTDHTGAHFLLDKDGTMYQTLQISKRCAHVAPVKSRCLAEIRCSSTDQKAYAEMAKAAGNSWGGTYNKAVGIYEAKKSYPDRYPFNPDAIGIEIVGKADKDTRIYENPTSQQNDYIHWFVTELLATLKLTPSDVYRHPMLSSKNDTEAAGVTW